MRHALFLGHDESISIAAERGNFADWECSFTSDPATADRLLRDRQFFVAVLVFDPTKPLISQDVVRLVGKSGCEWIAVTESGMLRDSRFGRFVVENFYDFHTVPIDPERFRLTLGHAYGKGRARHQLDKRPPARDRFGMIGDSAAMRALYRQLDKVIDVDAPVLLTGESGSGKELVAKAIHECSGRSKGPFIAMNCAAVPANLIQAELFGHEKGAFTGAHQRKIGNIEASHGGILFLDEIGDLSAELQTNLLRFLQEMTIVRLGATNQIRVDTRVVAATHVDLESAVADGRFRADLFYRLNVVNLRVPSLRERVDDIRRLARHVFDRHADKKCAQLQGFSEEALAAMEAYPWPGNVRELINRIRSAMIMSDGRFILPEDLGLQPSCEAVSPPTLEDARMHSEKEAIRQSLRRSGSNVSRAARQLGISRVTLYRLMSRHNI